MSIVIVVSYVDSSTRERRWSDMDWTWKNNAYVANNICLHYVIFLICISSQDSALSVKLILKSHKSETF